MQAPLEVPKVRELRHVLAQESAALEHVVSLLKREQDALVAARSDELEAIISAKNAGLGHIERLREQREWLLREIAGPQGAPPLAAVLARQPDLSQAMERLQPLAAEAKRLNALNGRLVSLQLQFVTARLEALRNAAGHERLYDAEGRADSATGSGRVIAAA